MMDMIFLGKVMVAPFFSEPRMDTNDHEWVFVGLVVLMYLFLF